MVIRLGTRWSFGWDYDGFIRFILAVRLGSAVVAILVDTNRWIRYQGLDEKGVGVTNTVI